MDYQRLHVMRFAGSALSDGVSVCLTSIARTVADCFKIRKTASHPSVREMSPGVVNSAAVRSRSILDSVTQFHLAQKKSNTRSDSQ
jgi:hypothetical protein